MATPSATLNDMRCGCLALRLEAETASVASFEACPPGRPVGVVLSVSRTLSLIHI